MICLIGAMLKPLFTPGRWQGSFSSRLRDHAKAEFGRQRGPLQSADITLGRTKSTSPCQREVVAYLLRVSSVRPTEESTSFRAL